MVPCLIGTEPLSEPMLVLLIGHIQIFTLRCGLAWFAIFNFIFVNLEGGGGGGGGGGAYLIVE